MLKAYYQKKWLEAGCDEAGRGCLAGPVFAAAVILPQDYSNPNLDDSKKLLEKQRDVLAEQIHKDALAVAIASCSAREIDEINILNASILAMHRALEQLDPQPKMILVDGNRFHTYHAVPHLCVIKGDGLYQSIAAASILAKTARDRFMEQLHHDYPEYGWNKNKGYPTATHQEAIFRHGLSPWHRKTFKSRGQLKLQF